MTIRRILGALTLLTLAGGLLAAPAVAAEPRTTASITVTDGSSPVAGISVFAVNEDPLTNNTDHVGYVNFGDTNSDGQIAKSRGNAPYNRLIGGTWTFHFSDSDRGRIADGTAFAPGEKTVTLTDGADTVVDLTAPPGNSLTGVVTAPSGRPVQNLSLQPVARSDDALDLDFTFFGSPRTSSTGSYLIGGLGASPYRVYGNTDARYELPSSTGIKVTFAGYGERKTENVENYQVQCEHGFTLRSSKSGRVAVNIRSSAASFGLAKPGGSVRLYRNGKHLKTLAWTGSTKTITLTGQPRGKKASYRVKYFGGDCFNWSLPKTVKIKK